MVDFQCNHLDVLCRFIPPSLPTHSGFTIWWEIVWEWCNDYYIPGYDSAAVTDPLGSTTPAERSYRGASFDFDANPHLTSSNRSHAEMITRSDNTGFRVVLPIR